MPGIKEFLNKFETVEDLVAILGVERLEPLIQAVLNLNNSSKDSSDHSDGTRTSSQASSASGEIGSGIVEQSMTSLDAAAQANPGEAVTGGGAVFGGESLGSGAGRGEGDGAANLEFRRKKPRFQQ